jgi:hypothetical protein
VERRFCRKEIAGVPLDDSTILIPDHDLVLNHGCPLYPRHAVFREAQRLTVARRWEHAERVWEVSSANAPQRLSGMRRVDCIERG